MNVSRTFQAAFSVGIALIFAATASAQMRKAVPVEVPKQPILAERGLGEVGKPVDTIIAGSQENQVLGRVTDFVGRSVRAARITLYCLDTDRVYRATSNSFGYYQFAGLTEGHSFLMSIDHTRYLFLNGSISITLDSEPVEIDFQAEKMP